VLDLQKLEEHLTKRGFGFSSFANKEEAVAYLDGKIDQTTVGIGGSMTVKEIGLYDKLTTHNQVAWHFLPGGKIADANRAEVYISSLNGIAETGELINIDGVGNRVSATAYGAKRVYFIVGKNKLAPDFEKALWRARNVAAPKNAARFGTNTPCVTEEPRCHDCSSPERICRELLVLWQKPRPVEEMEIVLILEDLGY
jgi:L-lactate utilization protein LutB